MTHRRRLRRIRPLRALTRPVQEFIATEASGGVVLLAAAALAIALANSPWSALYDEVLHHHIEIGAGFYSVDESVHFWVNDVAMVGFFFLVGLEIKRELAVGELSSMRRAMVPLCAAAGGMIVPALIFLVLVRDPSVSHGWGVPVATDIAFALAVATLLGSRVPLGLRVLLLGIAIFDDLGAVAVIAVFYSSRIEALPLLAALALLGLTYALRRSGVRMIPAYVAAGVVMWVAIYESGVHPTMVGVAMGLMTPATTALGETEGAPLARLEHALNPYVAFGIMPLFAFANAGVDLRGDALSLAASAWLTWGVGLGLVVGKPVGIFLATLAAVRLGAELPSEVRWSGVAGIGALAGIGFTVALFVAQLAYSDVASLTEAKVGIFGGSLVSGALGYALLRVLSSSGRRAAGGSEG